MKSHTKKNTQTPLFIEKLQQMLQDQQANEVISWTEDGENFVIKNVSAFTESTLPRYFKHRNYSSFIRQLNMYGFSKIRHQQGQNVYTNANFKRKNKSLLKNIKRKIYTDKEDKIVPYNGMSQPVSREIQSLRIKQKDLETVCKHLVAQNQKLLIENSNLMKKMKEQSREKDKKLQQLLLSLIMAQNNNALMNEENLIGKNKMIGPNIIDQDLNKSTQQRNSYLNQPSQQSYYKLLEEQKNVENLNKIMSFIYSGNGKGKYQLQNDALIDGNNQEKKDYLSQRAIDEILNSSNIEPIEPIESNPKQQSFLSINDFLNIDSGVGNDIQ